ncbi:poly(ADP-ribose) polymerase [Actinidia rufa]|uniref:Poly [ADP-ribose] polymerase n=1 Tax=Actinidia rufa TaxID=165716 RepID=A0A7J0H9G8_9ERIC|nr:poly(ADP-ribose) polymerase [Actinidia rufa]
MANKLKVEELRTELAQRGLSTTGTKPTLVRRLESAIRDESKQTIDSIEDSISKKRRRECENGDSNGSEKIKAVDEFRDMDIRQLRKEAALRGFSTSGSKKELIERLCTDPQKDFNEVIEVEEKEAVEKKEKIVTATKKGSAVLDQWLPDPIKTEYHVLQQGDEIYDAMLNQTNVGENNNKFYVLQVLESDDGGRFMIYNRWGRVGIKGQDKLHGPYTSRDSAIQEFEQKFFGKTRNYWSKRKDFICYPKCYTWLEMDYTDREKESTGYDVLKRIADVIGQSNRTKLEQLSGEFYTIIPHDFGFKKMREFVIDTPQKLKSKLEMVEALGEIEVATKLLEDDIQMQEDPLFSHYQRLHCELMPLEVDSEEFSMISTYMRNTHAKTHSNYNVNIVQIFRVSRQHEAERFGKQFSNTKNRMLLWHGSRLTNWTGILSQGLRIAPPEAPATGYMFGKGVYFADMFSKSANYCYSSSAATAGVLLLCEVALGDMAELLTANYDADKLPEGKLSTKGVGETAPDFSENQMLKDGVIVPLGKPKKQLRLKDALSYNEYIVYNVDQIRMRYVVQVDFNFKK